MYVLTGTIPVEGVIHKRTLSLFGNVTRQEKSSTEQQLALRQLTVKSLNSHSWFIAIGEIWIIRPNGIAGEPTNEVCMEA